MPKQWTKRAAIVVQPTHMYCRRVVRGIVEVGSEAAWEWLLVPTEGASAMTGSSAAALDGIIGYVADAAWPDELLRLGIPAVDISAAGAASNAVRVASDDVAVGRVVAAYLLSLGLPHYGFFGRRGREESRLRESGFTRTITAAGMSCPSHHWPVDELESGARAAHNAELAAWIAGLPKPVGVLASSDRRALQLLTVCRTLGIGSPEDVVVIGVGNDELLCELANPSLSSVALSTQRIGHEAARTLQRMMRGGPRATETTLLIPPVGVVPRQSSGRKVIIDPNVAAAVRYIALHVQDDLQVADVVREVLVSRRSLDQRFLKVLGRTPAQEISRAQVELARQVLAETDESMTRVAVMAGFSSAKQLGATFQSVTGTSPTAYRRQLRRTSV